MALEATMETFISFSFFAALLALKFFFMSLLKVYHKMTKKSFTSPEDTGKKNEVVERIGMAHLHDMENILPFFTIGSLFQSTNPSTVTAFILFLVFTLAIYLHTIVNAIFGAPSPARGICYFVAMLINIYMAIRVLISFSQEITFKEYDYGFW